MYLKICRKLNSNECYPCTVRAVKEIFGGTDIDISFGLLRKYEFDTCARKKPLISGVVIASLSINERERVEVGGNGLLVLYQVNKSLYEKSDQNLFENKYLPQMCEWYSQKKKSNQYICGVSELLVEWYNHEFTVNEIRYQ